MMRADYLLLTVFILLCACNNNDREYSVEPAEKADTVYVDNSGNNIPEKAMVFANNSGFSAYAKSKLPGFDWNKATNTRFWKQDSMHTTNFTPDNNFYAAYGSLLKYSPDSSKFIDLDSYNIAIRRDGTGRLTGNDQGPDTEVSLVDVKNNRKSRLLFMGPGNSVEDAGWLDNNTLALVGLQQSDSATATHAVMYLYDLTSGMVHMYEQTDTGKAADLKGYSRRERLKDVIMRRSR